jgi:hypothetical protein
MQETCLNLVNSAIMDRIWTISAKICIKSEFLVPGFLVPIPGLNPEETRPEPELLWTMNYEANGNEQFIDIKPA